MCWLMQFLQRLMVCLSSAKSSVYLGCCMESTARIKLSYVVVCTWASSQAPQSAAEAGSEPQLQSETHLETELLSAVTPPFDLA
jgi:hypothetical protein